MKKLTSLLLALVLCFSAVACAAPATESTTTATTTTATAGSSATETEELPVIRAAVMDQQLGLPLYYIHEQGWDVENGFVLELTTFQSGAPMNEALGANLWDICTIGAAGVLSCSVYDAVHIMSHEDSSAGLDLMVRADSDIASISGYVADRPDLLGDPETIKGATFLFPIGSGHHLLLGEYLHAMGLEESDVKMVNMDHPSSYQAFVAGEGDYSATAYPLTDTYIKEGYVSAANMISADCPYYDNLVVSRGYFESNQDVLVKLLVQVLRCADAFTDEELLLATMVEWYEVNGQTVDPEEVRSQVLLRPFLTVSDYTSSDTTASFRSMAEFFNSIDSITDEDLEKVLGNIDSTVLEKAIAEYEAQY